MEFRSERMKVKMTEPTSGSVERYLPYPSIQGFNEGLQQLKNVSANTKIDRDLLKRGGVAPNNESKVIKTFEALGLIGQSGELTDLGRRVRSIDGEDVEALGMAVDTLYDGLFEALPESSRTEQRIKNFFKVSYGVSEEVANRATVFFVDLCRRVNRPLAIAEQEKTGRRDANGTAPKPRKTPSGSPRRSDRATNHEKPRVQELIETPHSTGQTFPIQVVIHLNAETVALDQTQIRSFLHTVLSTLNDLGPTSEALDAAGED